MYCLFQQIISCYHCHYQIIRFQFSRRLHCHYCCCCRCCCCYCLNRCVYCPPNNKLKIFKYTNSAKNKEFEWRNHSTKQGNIGRDGGWYGDEIFRIRYQMATICLHFNFIPSLLFFILLGYIEGRRANKTILPKAQNKYKIFSYLFLFIFFPIYFSQQPNSPSIESSEIKKMLLLKWD